MHSRLLQLIRTNYSRRREAVAYCTFEVLRAVAECRISRINNEGCGRPIIEVDELTQPENDREQSLDQMQLVITKQKVLLDHDSDIRELMGEAIYCPGSQRRETRGRQTRLTAV